MSKRKSSTLDLPDPKRQLLLPSETEVESKDINGAQHRGTGFLQTNQNPHVVEAFLPVGTMGDQSADSISDSDSLPSYTSQRSIPLILGIPRSISDSQQTNLHAPTLQAPRRFYTAAESMGEVDEDDQPPAPLVGARGPRSPMITAVKAPGRIHTGITTAQAAAEVKIGCDRVDKGLKKPNPTFTRCEIRGEIPLNAEKAVVGKQFLACLKLRKKFVWQPKTLDRRIHNIRDNPTYTSPKYDPSNLPPALTSVSWRFVDGVIRFYSNDPTIQATAARYDGVNAVSVAATTADPPSTKLSSSASPSPAASLSLNSPVPSSVSLAKRSQRSTSTPRPTPSSTATPSTSLAAIAANATTATSDAGELSSSSGTSSLSLPQPILPFSSTPCSSTHLFVSGASSTSVDPSLMVDTSSLAPTSSLSSEGNEKEEQPLTINTVSGVVPAPTAVDCATRVGDICDDSPVEKLIISPPTWVDYCEALAYVISIATNGPCRTYAFTRLKMLETQKDLHSLLNHELEIAQSKAVPHRDFYNVRKIDNHVHHSACMNQKHLLRYIKKKIKQPEAQTEPVIMRDGQPLTLQQVFDSLKLTAYDLSIDTLDMHASQTFQRFDKFNLKYNPIGESRLREIFLKFNNMTGGKFIAEITQEVFTDLEANKYQFAEYRISIYGREKKEWDTLAEWVVDTNLYSANARWMIQIPRLYSVYKKAGQISCLQDMLTNFFAPLVEVTLDPSSHPKLHTFLQSVVGFDCVDDESVRTRFFDSRDPPPDKWSESADPHYCAFLYYLYANMWAVNKLREMRGMNGFTLRPHAGEAGDIEHVASSFLVAHGINHGLTLNKSPPLQFLYYLCQSGISMSPLSNNLLFLEYQKNPFPKYFARGLNVALSTDDPLMIHVTKEPLVEEYSVASQVWKLSSIDMCEIARNSVLQSGFEPRFKAHWLGSKYWEKGIVGNDIRCTNVPDIRVQFRWDLLLNEHQQLAHLADQPLDLGLIDPVW